MNYEKIIGEYNALIEKCMKLIKNDDGTILSQDYWLRTAIQREDLELAFHNGEIECYGRTYTTQTMGFEPFTFYIPTELIEESND